MPNTFVTFVLFFVYQLDYENDEEWIKWNSWGRQRIMEKMHPENLLSSEQKLFDLLPPLKPGPTINLHPIETEQVNAAKFIHEQVSEFGNINTAVTLTSQVHNQATSHISETLVQNPTQLTHNMTGTNTYVSLS